ncbi:MAG TPA: hypothetical protein VL156_16720 [Terriglobales bacterium]|jgi:hypothetical protein|nr:hypothetical protein [Terriglobales bacterium]
MQKRCLVVSILLLIIPGSALAQAGACSGMTVGQLTSLNGFVPFPSDSLWNTDISSTPVDPNSTNIINFIGSTVALHPDFGSGQIKNQTIGIPYQVVAGTQAKVNVTLNAFADESDPGPEPIPSNALIEGYPKPGNGDRHVLVLEKDGCWLYELYNASVKNGAWSADQASLWDMTIDEQRPYTWTSADAAGLPVFVGLARYDEVAAGAINHALRFTVPASQRAFVLPATHWASTNTNPSAPPMGTRLRLKSSFDISGFPADDQVILTALKKYGMILADNGSAIFISGAPDSRWNNSDLNLLKSITASNFEVVQQGTIYTPGNVPTGASPTISSFTANPASISAGQPVTLSWSTLSSTYNIVSPTVGPVRGTGATVNPSVTTTYTLYSTNQYGRTLATVTVTVH